MENLKQDRQFPGWDSNRVFPNTSQTCYCWAKRPGCGSVRE